MAYELNVRGYTAVGDYLLPNIAYECDETLYFCSKVLFRQYDVHFVAVGNNVDSNDQNSNDFVPLKNLFNE